MATQHWVLLGSGAGLGAGIGAGLMYLLDPEGGEKRRALVRDKATQALHAGGESLRQASKDLGERGRDLYASAGSRLKEGKELLEAKVQQKAKDLPARAGNGLSKREKLASAARLVAGAAGGALALAALNRRGKAGVALGSMGLGLLATGGLSHSKTGIEAVAPRKGKK